MNLECNLTDFFCLTVVNLESVMSLLEYYACQDIFCRMQKGQGYGRSSEHNYTNTSYPNINFWMFILPLNIKKFLLRGDVILRLINWI